MLVIARNEVTWQSHELNPFFYHYQRPPRDIIIYNEKGQIIIFLVAKLV